ncbi:MAG TPA: ABC transporter ATP-binding protein [Vicinamibacterales bacterium]|nr:ABC transporter ATP-binding protein [Vicinamibacterales bacterium]
MSLSARPRVIEVAGLSKHYGSTRAVQDVSLHVFQGEIFGLIGPNGAGKTTTMECIEGLRVPDTGSVSVLGLDPFTDVVPLLQRIGVQLQEAQLQKRITVAEAIGLWSSLYRTSIDGRQLLEQLGIAAKSGARFMTLSGGQKQRLFIALALINDPEVVFLDELTTGLDPQARRAIWDLVRGIRDRGKTVFLTTHLMEEAERLCDRVAIIDHGRVVDVDSPAALVARHCPERTIVITTTDDRAADLLGRVRGVESSVREGAHVILRAPSVEVMTGLIGCLAQERIEVTDFRTIVPTLEEVFLKLTGHSVRQ